MDNKLLINYAKNVNSQCGEDGIIAEICRRLHMKAGWFVEFGAWDGKHLSNTYALIAEGWKGVYIEGDETKFSDLIRTRDAHSDSIEAVCAYVGFEGENTLDVLLSRTATPRTFDLLSIDIDSYDFQVWHSMQKYSGKIVVIEGNSEVLPGIWQIHQDGVVQGSSFTALVALGESKGYKLVCHTGNLIFVRKDLVDQLNIDPVGLLFPETLFNYQKYFAELAYRHQLERQTLLSPVRRLAQLIKLRGRSLKAAASLQGTNTGVRK